MREIGSIANEQDARVLADYLLTLNISTKIEPKAGTFVVWVHREDRVAEARVVLAEFQANPAESKFHAASQTARQIRKNEEKLERDYQKKVKNLRDRWEGSMYQRAPLAFGLIVVSVIVFLFMNMSDSSFSFVIQTCDFSVKVYDDDGGVKDTGADAILGGQVWRLITPIFVHLGIMHLVFNMMGMRYLGERVEMRKGTGKFAILVFVSAITSNAAESLLQHTQSFGGMSGVIFAIAGYLWIKGHTDPEDHLSLDDRNVRLMLSWFLLGILAPYVMTDQIQAQFPMGLGYLLHMANVAHGVGLATGVVFGLLRF